MHSYVVGNACRLSSAKNSCNSDVPVRQCPTLKIGASRMEICQATWRPSKIHLHAATLKRGEKCSQKKRRWQRAGTTNECGNDSARAGGSRRRNRIPPRSSASTTAARSTTFGRLERPSWPVPRSLWTSRIPFPTDRRMTDRARIEHRNRVAFCGFSVPLYARPVWGRLIFSRQTRSKPASEDGFRPDRLRNLREHKGILATRGGSLWKNRLESVASRRVEYAPIVR